MNSLHYKDFTYKRLSDEAYSMKDKSKIVLISYPNGEDATFKIVAFRQNKFNGLKMAALSPMKKDGEVNTDELYMVYAGTEPTADFGADIFEDTKIGLAKFGGGLQFPTTRTQQQLYGNVDKKVIGSNEKFSDFSRYFITDSISQSKESFIFTESVIKKQKPKHVYGAGHSLGGGLAMLNGVMHNFNGVRVFSAPNTFDLLPKEVKESYKAEKYDGKFFNYLHRSDLIGNHDLFAERIGLQVYAEDVENDGLLGALNPISGHSITTFDFNGDSVRIKMNMDEMKRIADKLINAVDFVDDAIKKLEDYMDETEKIARRIEQKYIDKIDSGNYKYIRSIDISDHMQEISVSRKYKFYNEEYFDSALNELHNFKNKTTVFAQQLMYAGVKMESRDKELGELYRIFEE
ncbi:hypothetical protein J9174_04715 [Macrococcoides canis]|uniref:hypothetical protein n=1 Tax=Macrococcoides canis TaxID=1855823 RepID=UPI001AEBC1D3|nr:hypothetical protein [Macrococcus canis]QTQ08978.1 hypothetical protein J9174_04715 [Macrococcus canis]